MQNGANKRNFTKRMLLIFIAVACLLLWFFSSQFAGLPKGTKPQLPAQLMTTQGTSIKASEFVGKPLVINFWATWCGPCLVELPGFVRAARKFDNRVRFIGFAVDSTLSEVLKFQDKFQIPYPIVMAPIQMLAAWRAEQLPITYILNREGEIAWSHRGYASESELVAAMESVLSENL